MGKRKRERKLRNLKKKKRKNSKKIGTNSRGMNTLKVSRKKSVLSESLVESLKG